MIGTGGGRYDPADKFIYFVAGAHITRGQYPRYCLTAVNEAMAPGAEADAVAKPVEAGARLLLDSGIFALTNEHKRRTGMSMDQALALPPEAIIGFGELYSRYVTLAKRYEHDLWGYIELDQGGRDNKRRTRARLEAEGLRPIPVYHPLNDGWDYFDELAESYDRICFGNIVQASPNMRVRLLLTMWERRRRYPHLWIHILGLTVNEWCTSIPPDSCDSSTWCGALRWGTPSTESAHLRRGIGHLPQGFTYDQDAGYHDPRGWLAAARCYADAANVATDGWRQIMTDLSALGVAPWPAVEQREGELSPA